MTEVVIRRIEEDPREGMRLGRSVKHDPRSRSYAIEAAPLGTLRSVRHHRGVPVFDQGDVGCCVPNAGAGVLSTAPFHHHYGEPTARRWYHQLTGWPQAGDPGSTGLDMAKLLKDKGLITSYSHAFSLEAALTALQTTAVLIGIEWRTGCDTPDSDGRIRWTGTVRGGHEVEVDEIDVDNRLVWITNSWGSGWGVNGRAAFTWDDLGKALAQQGDCTVLVAQ